MLNHRRSDDPSTAAQMIEKRKAPRTDAQLCDVAMKVRRTHFERLLAVSDDLMDTFREARWLHQAEPECAALMARLRSAQ